ncbi:SURF1 family protein [Nocardioides houyundeii]|uniref:SURF1 family protein n=1 Tax=Nocardioides houyundeii TaxID=2045452 RepID=UPI000DF22B64|nr:SURF1 family protein [Nocardioides houyundeii]
MSIHPLLRPFSLGMHLVAVVLVAIAMLLGVWQVQVWQDERSDAAAGRAELEPVPLADSLGPDDPFPTSQVGMPVRMSGTWVPEGTVLVSGRRQGDQDGYWVVTPLAVPPDGDGAAGPDDPALLVVRGWTAGLDDVPAPPQGEAEIVGWLQPPEGSTGATDEDRSDDVIPQVRIADAIQHVDQDLYGAYLVVDTDSAELRNPGIAGLAPADLDELPEVGRGTGIRNLLYGIEWWVFAGFAAFIWWRWCADEVRAARAAAMGEQLSERDTVEV